MFGFHGNAWKPPETRKSLVQALKTLFSISFMTIIIFNIYLIHANLGILRRNIYLLLRKGGEIIGSIYIMRVINIWYIGFYFIHVVNEV